jgi:archaeal flagellar protein FlaJ
MEPHPSALPIGFGTQMALRVFGGLAERRLPRHPELSSKLLRAGSPLVPVSYLANVYGSVALAAAVGTLPLVAGIALLASGVGGPARTLVLLLLLPVLLGGMTYSFALLQPDLQAKSRRRNLEANLPYALNFMAALASAGVVPFQVFGALGQQKVYGEAAREASLLYRDAKLFSKDFLTALRAAARRSPSPQWEEFLSGSINTITSGGDLATYLLAKSEQYVAENRRRQKSFLESMGVMAESYVVVGAAAPLFLLVILSVMALLSSGINPVVLMNLLALGGLPVIHGMFAYILRTMRAD